MCFLLSLGSVTHAQPVYNPLDTMYFAPQNMGVWFSRQGWIAYNPHAMGNGCQWPSSGRRSLVFLSTFVFGGKVADTIRASGNNYWQCYRPGPIMDGKLTADTLNERYRIHRIRKGDVTSRDYLEWPGELGAPVDASGRPLLYGVDQIFFIMNDLDTTRIRKNFFSTPLGLEVHCLVWAHDVPFLRDVLFIKYTYIHKGVDSVRNAYILHFVDHDLGHPGDDLVGSDTLRRMVYGYNAPDVDAGYGLPPALGVVAIQTPIVKAAPESIARWKNGFVRGYRNVNVSSTVAPLKNYGNSFRDVWPSPTAPQRWYSFMKGEGFNEQMINPKTGVPSSFWFSGDPISQTGWIMSDGFTDRNGTFYPEQPADKRMAISTGPFDFAPGDTQEVVIAYVAARASRNTSAIQGLRDLAEAARAVHDFTLTMSSTKVEIISTSADETDLELIAEGQPGESVAAQVLSMSGDTLATVPLHDDGLHGDDAANDGVYRATQTFKAQLDGVNVSFLVSHHGSQQYHLPGKLSIPLVGSVAINSIKIVDEYNDDGRANPGEELRLNNVIQNDTNWELEGMFVDRPVEFVNLYGYERIPYPVIPSHGIKPDNDSTDVHRSYSFSVPVDAPLSTSYTWNFDLFQPQENNYWFDTASVFVEPPLREAYDALMIHLKGPSTQRLGVRILDPSQLQDRTYVATIEGGYPRWGGTRSASLHDSLTGLVLTKSFALDGFEGRAPVQDGFRIVNGTITYLIPLYKVEHTTPTIDSLFYKPNLNLSNELQYSDYKPVIIRFGPPGQSVHRFFNKIYRGYLNQSIQAYTLESDGTRRQINVAIHSDSLYWFVIYLFHSTYTNETIDRYTHWPISSESHDVISSLMSRIHPFLELPEITGEIVARPLIPATAEDVYIFQPRHFLIARRLGSSSGFQFGTSYPNPFHTSIAIPFEIEEDAHVRIDIYNGIGQHVHSIYDAFTTKGKSVIFWDGRWDDNRRAVSGIYFVRMTANGKTQSQPLMLIK